ncbi:MAG: hypothetical protein Q9209_003085 [Squamulea sp. 1 TL-2023]
MHFPMLVSSLLLVLSTIVTALPVAKPDLNPNSLEPQLVRSWRYSPAAHDHDYPPAGIPPRHLDSKRDIDPIKRQYIPTMDSYPPVPHYDPPLALAIHKSALITPANDRTPITEHDNTPPTKLKDYLQDHFPIGGPSINNPPQTDEKLEKRAI